MTSSCRTSRVILSVARGDVRSSALMATAAAISENISRRNGTARRFILPPSGRVRQSAGLIVASNMDERRWGGAQYSLGIGGRKSFHLGRNVHRTKLRPAHRTEVSILESILRQGFVMHGASRLRIE